MPIDRAHTLKLLSTSSRPALLAGLLAVLPPVAAEVRAADAGGSAAGPALTLPAVTVEAKGESPLESPKGYVARSDLTGTKTDTPIIATPQSITVIPRDQMNDQGVRTVGEALRYTAGVYSDSRPGNRFDSLFLRGFGGFGGGANYVEYLDGLRLQRGLSYAVPSIDPFLLERVEVARGPASVLYGQASPGGIVNLTSKRPTATPFGEAVAAYGTNKQGYAGLDFGGPIDPEGKLLYRFTGIGRKGEGDVDHVEEERVAIAPAFTWRPDDDTTLTVLSSYQRDPKSYYAPFLPAQGTILPNRNGTIPTSFDPGDPGFDTYSRTQGAIGYQFEHTVSDRIKVRQNARYLHIDSTFRALSLSGLAADQRTMTRRSTLSQENVNTAAVDNQGELTFSTGALAHTLLGGVDYQYGFADRALGNGTAPNIVWTAPVYNQRIANPAITSQTSQRQQQLGLYAQDQMRLDRWAFLLGLRHDWANSKTTDKRANSSVTQSDTAFTWRAGAVYLFDNGLAPYASYATSFQPQTGTDWAGSPFEPSKGRQYEVGVKFQPKGVNSYVTVAGFHLTQENVLTADTAHPGFSTPTGEVTSQGVEVEAKASLTDGLDLIASYAYTDITNTKTTVAANRDKRPVGAPEHLASLWGHYTFHEGPVAGFALGAGVRYIGASAGDPANTVEVPSATLVDAMLSYDLENLTPKARGAQVQLNATNLFDKEYVSGCASSITCFYGAGRSVLASLRYRW